MDADDAESRRLAEDARREKNWKRWGPYLSRAPVGHRPRGLLRRRRQLGARSPTSIRSAGPTAGARTGLLGISDRECRLCFALALWNGRDPHLKERLFGLTNPEGNHSEDVKEVYFYLDATPTHCYLKALYKYPQGDSRMRQLRGREQAARAGANREYELTDTGAFDGDRYWDVVAEYAKAAPDDLLIRFTASQPRPGARPTLHLLPTLWFRNTWSWGAAYDEGRWAKPRLARIDGGVLADHETLGRFRPRRRNPPPAEWVFTENETNPRRLRQRRRLRRAVQGRLPSLRRRWRHVGRPRGRRHQGGGRLPLGRPGRRRARCCACGSSPRTATPPRRSPTSIRFRRREFARRMISTPAKIPAEPSGRGAGRRPAGLRRPALERAVLPLRRARLGGRRFQAPEPAGGRRTTASTATGCTCSAATSSRSRTSGSTRPSSRGTWPST